MTVALVLSCLSWSCADGTVPDQVNSVEDGAEDLTGDGVEDLAGDEGTDGAGDGSLTTDTDEQDGDELDGAVDGGTDGSNDESHTTDQPDESAAEDTTDEGETEDAAVDEDGHAADTVDTDGPDSDGDATVSCVNDDGCTIGEQWCVGGECVPCENSGTRCAIECDHGWETYSRNGCTPCECAPTNACVSDETCETEGDHCYAGEFCWDWCPPDDPSCCKGNICSAPSCAEPPGTGCVTRGCPQGELCRTGYECVTSGCFCTEGNWLCNRDCAGGGCYDSCETDSDCTFGEAWCVEGACVPCDNSAELCDIECLHDWELYARNGCTPCECAPTNACVSDDTCETEGDQCYAGEFCWDWCPPGDPSCCFGNICSAPGCSGSPSGLTCRTRGCAQGQSCATDLDSCASTGCSCNGLNWLCRADCEKTSCR